MFLLTLVLGTALGIGIFTFVSNKVEKKNQVNSKKKRNKKNSKAKQAAKRLGKKVVHAMEQIPVQTNNTVDKSMGETADLFNSFMPGRTPQNVNVQTPKQR